ncbi:hypothetical protein AX15_002125 [Amanita polypyramis BW_CC]|nr:hypothetical protein AX15_002125 [Amanita polypyramis BW_CC]
MVMSRCLWYILIPLFLWPFWLLLVSLDRRAPTDPPLVSVLDTASLINASSLTAILPVTPDSLANLPEQLATLYDTQSCLYEILVESPQSLALYAKNIVHTFVHRFSEPNRPIISVHLYTSVNGSGLSQYGSKVSTEWVLILDENALDRLDASTRHKLLNPLALPIPFGICGMANGSCVSSSDFPLPVSYIVPPFVIPTPLLRNSECFNRSSVPIGARKSCAVILPQPSHSVKHCSCSSGIDFDERWDPFISKNDTASSNGAGQFTVLVPTTHDLRTLSPLLCRLQLQTIEINTLIYADGGQASGKFRAKSCSLHYRLVIGRNNREQLLRLVDEVSMLKMVDVIIIPKGEFPLSLKPQRRGQVIVEIPRADFQYSQWMGSLTLQEWLNWNIPHLDITIITQDRPWSLKRLLFSLSQGLYFGDDVNLRINLEQASDQETMKIVNSFSWNYGAITIHHRVIHGGLLPAVVESWYPHTNHTYALLLEDDVELSPLFYAWIKMSILRYRYRDKRNRSPQLFGVSLYQQKNMELPLDGRRHFNARALFQRHDLDPSTPYLSPVPCSWGAVYFPEHWREFHDYIAIRLSESALDIEQKIVPNVRSNNWAKSWKKYFIELVFLRGYVMLYPNFNSYISLSTNHLEVGSHVKYRTKEKQDMFLLPLMKIPRIPSEELGILELPNETLPFFEGLPVINLTGGITQLDTLIDGGLTRRLELLNCLERQPTLFDARSLMCITF